MYKFIEDIRADVDANGSLIVTLLSDSMESIHIEIAGINADIPLTAGKKQYCVDLENIPQSPYKERILDAHATIQFTDGSTSQRMIPVRVSPRHASIRFTLVDDLMQLTLSDAPVDNGIIHIIANGVEKSIPLIIGQEEYFYPICEEFKNPYAGLLTKVSIFVEGGGFVFPIDDTVRVEMPLRAIQTSFFMEGGSGVLVLMDVPIHDGNIKIDISRYSVCEREILYSVKRNIVPGKRKYRFELPHTLAGDDLFIVVNIQSDGYALPCRELFVAKIPAAIDIISMDALVLEDGLVHGEISLAQAPTESGAIHVLEKESCQGTKIDLSLGSKEYSFDFSTKSAKADFVVSVVGGYQVPVKTARKSLS